jgi:hypothetical protein
MCPKEDRARGRSLERFSLTTNTVADFRKRTSTWLPTRCPSVLEQGLSPALQLVYKVLVCCGGRVGISVSNLGESEKLALVPVRSQPTEEVLKESIAFFA